MDQEPVRDRSARQAVPPRPPGGHCCAEMTEHLERPIRENAPTADRWDGDQIVAYTPRSREYGLPVHDGGRSEIVIRFCPWCGTRLPKGVRDARVDLAAGRSDRGGGSIRSQLQIGYLPDMCVLDALELLPAALRAPYALISAIDSARTVHRSTELVDSLLRREIDCLEVGDGVGIALDDVWRVAEDDNYFTGFDELWLFDSAPSASPPETAAITADRFIAGPDAAAISSWMATSGCRVGFGDGDGAYWVTHDERLATALKLHSIPDPFGHDSVETV
jgi:hypothetical protein